MEDLGFEGCKIDTRRAILSHGKWRNAHGAQGIRRSGFQTGAQEPFRFGLREIAILAEAFDGNDLDRAFRSGLRF